MSAVLLKAGNARPRPTLIKISCGATCTQKSLCTPICVNQANPPAATRRPTVIGILGPIFGTRPDDAPAARMMPNAKGRKASPALSAE